MQVQLSIPECVRRYKIGQALKGRKLSEEHKRRISVSERGKFVSPETKKKMSEAWKTRPPITEETKQKQSRATQKIADSGYYQTEEYRKLVSMGVQGVALDDWTHFVSYEPYCPKFNFPLKEKIRNRDERKCVVCEKCWILNGKRLSVHHIDHDKMQGCDEKPFYLASLCMSCSAKANANLDLYEFLIVANNQWRSNENAEKKIT